MRECAEMKNPPPQKAWGIENYKEWVMKFTEEKGWQRFNLLGHSFGRGIAIKIAADPALFKKGGVFLFICCVYFEHQYWCSTELFNYLL